MATNKHALIRYRTIDKCLQNTGRRWTLDDLIDTCSDALYEAEGKETLVSRRTVQLDLQTMRSDKLGYAAPIEVYERKYYRYADPDYSIANLPLQEVDLDIISESVAILRQFKDFSLFAELNGVIQKLEDRIHHSGDNASSIVHIDKNENLKGLEFLDTIYQAIRKQIVLKMEYRSFKAQQPRKFLLHGYILKEYNNRWFVIGRKHGQEPIITLALDRILSIEPDLQTDYEQRDFDPDAYYANTYGVSVLSERFLQDIELEIDANNAPYVLTKPIHRSQELLRKLEGGRIVIGLRLHLNFELERLILGMGESVKVLRPQALVKRIKWKLGQALAQYKD